MRMIPTDFNKIFMNKYAVVPIMFLLAFACCPKDDFELTENDNDRMPAYSEGSYTVNGDTLTLQGNGTTVLKNSSELTLYREPGTESVKFTTMKTETDIVSIFTNNICRAWVPVNTIVTIRPTGSARLGRKYEGCDIGEIITDLTSMRFRLKSLSHSNKYSELTDLAAKIRDDYQNSSKGMKVRSICFTKNETLVVSFENDHQPMVGTWHWLDEQTGLFSCSITIAGADGEPLNASSSAQILYNAKGECQITADAAFSTSWNNYNATISWVCRDSQNNH